MKHTRRALALWDEIAPTIERMVMASKTQTELDEAFMLSNAYVENVCRSFYEDTKDRNSLHNCMLLHPGPAVPQPGQELSFVRRMAREII